MHIVVHHHAAIAHQVERMFRKHEVVGSSPTGSSRNGNRIERNNIFDPKEAPLRIEKQIDEILAKEH